MDLGLLAIGVGIVALSLLGAGLGMGMAVSKAMEAVGRQPEACGKINQILLVGLAMVESVAIYGFVTALLVIFVLGAK